MGLQTYRRLDGLTRRWWFFVLMAMLFFVPSYSARPYDPRVTSDLVTAVLSQPLISTWSRLFPAFKIAPMLLIVLIIRLASTFCDRFRDNPITDLMYFYQLY